LKLLNANTNLILQREQVFVVLYNGIILGIYWELLGEINKSELLIQEKKKLLSHAKDTRVSDHKNSLLWEKLIDLLLQGIVRMERDNLDFGI